MANANTSTTASRHLRRALIAASCAAALAACGSATKTSTKTTSTSYSQGVRYSDCMRSHGVSNFPDPSPDGGYRLSSSAINPQSPAFKSASAACAKLRPGGNAPPPALTEAQHKAMVLNARCIREHGVPNFPDPTITPSSSPSGDPFLPGNVNPRAPAVERAARACAHVGTPIPGVGIG